MRNDAESIALLAKSLEDRRRYTIRALCVAVHVCSIEEDHGHSTIIAEDDYADPAEGAAFLGTVEGLWQAFADGVIRAAGYNGTPRSILTLDFRSQAAAQKAYRAAYKAATAERGKA